MIRIEVGPWQVMVEHARKVYPRECCGIMLGRETEGDKRQVTLAIACRNAYEGDQSDRFALDPREQVAAERRAREEGLEVLGFFHSHPDHGMYFSATDLKHSWPWYSNIVLSIEKGAFATAGSFRANEDQTAAVSEELDIPV
jgi:proteasome lid subunit RPN8/RPN11